MSREDIVAVATRLFVVYLAFRVISIVPSTMQMIQIDGGFGWNYSTAMMCLVLALFALAGLFLWHFPLTVARKLLPVMREPRSEQSVDAPVAMALGLALIGVWMLAYGLIDGLYWLTLLLRTHQINSAYSDWTADQLASMVSTAAQIIIGLWLVLGHGGLRRLIYRFRYGRLPGE